MEQKLALLRLSFFYFKIIKIVYNDFIVNEKNKIYFAVSDIHGAYDEFMKVLNKNGFDLNNETHFLIVAGDIINGLGQDIELLDYLINFPKNRLLIVKGNHDIDRNKIKKTNITNEHKQWLKKLPVRLKTNHFYVAHGIYDENVKDISAVSHSPFVIHKPIKEWMFWNEDVDLINSKYVNFKHYINFYNKPIFLGHFPPCAQIRLKGNVNPKILENGCYLYETNNNMLICLDGDFKNGGTLNVFKFIITNSGIEVLI